MPIKFRCPHCEQFLGISRSKAGAVTDCPMCGRTIRVPQLDGSVAPLPKPTMNHGDSGLARALDALASLAEGASGAVAVSDAQPEKPVAISLAPAPAVEPVPIPVPLPPETPGRAAGSSLSRPTPPPTNVEVSASPGLDPLRELSSIKSTAVPRTTRPARGQSRILMTGAVCGLLGITSGFLLGRKTGPSAAPTVSAPEVLTGAVIVPPGVVTPGGVVLGPVGESPLAALPVSGELQRAIEGRVTYLTATGESRPDVGARVLVIPSRHPAVSKLPVMSFRAGANPGEVRLAQAQIRALGGDFALVSPDGHYEIQLPSTGQYQFLLVSRYQARLPESSPETGGMTALRDWLDTPLLFFGQTQSMTTNIQFDGQRSTLRDHVFTRVE